MSEISNTYSVFTSFRSRNYDNKPNNTYYANRVISNSSKSGLPKDVLEKSNTSGVSTKQKVAIGVGATVVALAGLLFGGKSRKSNKLASELEKVEQNFNNLEQNLPEVKKTFKEVFLRQNMTDDEALKLLREYKEVEKIRVTGTAEEYAQALFNQAVKAYDLEHANIPLKIVSMGNTNVVGGWQRWRNTVTLKKEAMNNKDDIFTIIHHELRHAKQTQAIVETQPVEAFLGCAQKSSYEDTHQTGDFDEFVKRVWTPDFTEYQLSDVLKIKRQDVKPSSSEVEYGKTMLESLKNYVKSEDDLGGYWRNVQEVDARKAETLMNKLFGYNVDRLQWLDKMDKKYL